MIHLSNLGFGEYREGEKIGPACWKCHDLFVVVRGKVSLEVNSRFLHLAQGDAVLIPPDSPFTGHVCSKISTIWVMHFRGYAPIFRRSRFIQRRTALLIHKAISDLFYRQCVEKMDEIFKMRNSSPQRATLHHLANLLLAHMEEILFTFRNSSHEAKPFDEILTWARKNLPSVQTHTLARKAGLSDSHFRAQFRKFYHTSPSKILRDFRLQEAKHLLQQSHYSIKEISHRTGYGDAVSFHRAFKNTGFTPAKYRSLRPTIA